MFKALINDLSLLFREVFAVLKICFSQPTIFFATILFLISIVMISIIDYCTLPAIVANALQVMSLLLLFVTLFLIMAAQILFVCKRRKSKKRKDN